MKIKTMEKKNWANKKDNKRRCVLGILPVSRVFSRSRLSKKQKAVLSLSGRTPPNVDLCYRSRCHYF